MWFKERLLRLLETRTLWITLLVPLLLSPLPIVVKTTVAKTGYCVIVIAIFWVTEVMPLPVTSLLPVVLFPLFGVMSAKDTCSAYADNTLMLFLGSLMVAAAVERWNLHRRVALRTLSFVGPQPMWLMFGIMFPTWFLSMWMSNTATAAMMMPIVNAIVEQIRLSRHPEEDGMMLNKNESAVDDIESNVDEREENFKVENEKEYENEMYDDEDRSREGPLTGREIIELMKREGDDDFVRLAKSFSLCVAFAANVGGMATLTGTPPNMIFSGIADGMFKEKGGSPINFANWLGVGLPVAAILFFFTWGWLYVYTVGKKAFNCCGEKESYDAVRDVIQRQASQLGRITFPEIVVLINFIILAILWISRMPGFSPGWGNALPAKFSGDSIPAIFIGVMLFILPAKPIKCICSKDFDPNQSLGYQPILNWTIVNEKVAWGVLLLMGGGFAVAKACKVSGLSAWVSNELLGLSYLDPWGIAFLLSIMISLATQVTSNSATATLFLPIVGEMAISLNLHPLYFMIPCTIATSLAFLLPVATPPNAIVFSSGYLEVTDMVLAGLPINIVSLVVVNIALNSWVMPLYSLDSTPFASDTTVPPFEG